MLYFAYGSNLHADHMARRCPGSRRVGTAFIAGWRLTFRGVADVEPHRGGRVLGALYDITRADEDALDRYEGWPLCYSKMFCTVTVDGRERDVMFYRINRDGYRRGECSPPGAHYYQVIHEGFGHWGLDRRSLEGARRRVTRAVHDSPRLDTCACGALNCPRYDDHADDFAFEDDRTVAEMGG